MSRPELDFDDPSVAFGQNQGLFAYNMAASLTGSTDRPLVERARDAARTAIQKFDCPEVDEDLATRGLLHALEDDFNFDTVEVDDKKD
jgi:hypothetical protein